MAAAPSTEAARRTIVHFVTGGFSGATQVAIDLARAQHAAGHRVVLAMRRKRQTPLPRVEALRAEGLDLRLIPGGLKLWTILSLRRLLREQQPDLLFAHGFPEHLIGRVAGRWAGVPHMVQVEHNSRERYTPLRAALTRRLAACTDRIVGVSPGVRDSLLAQGLPAAKLQVIANGIRPERFAALPADDWLQRESAFVMAARFASQKDHATLIEALALLRDREGLRPRLRLAGGGSSRHRERALALLRQHRLEDQVELLGHVADMPALLARHKYALLISHYEGMPLSLIEAMAAGCLCIASEVPGIAGVIEQGRNGWLVPHADAAALARRLADCLRHEAAQLPLVAQGRREAFERYTQQRMADDYAALIDELTGRAAAPAH